MAKFLKGVKLCFVIMIMKLGHNSALMLFGCSLNCSLNLNGCRLLSLTILLGVETWLIGGQRKLFSAYFCSYFGISSAFCSNTSSLPLGQAWSIALSTIIMPYISPRTISFTISLWSRNHSGALKCFTAVPENVVVGMTGWHQDSPSVFLT